MGGSKKQTIGYRYRLGVQLGLCHGELDAISRIYVEDKLLWDSGTTAWRSNASIDKPNFFGGVPPKGEGGISGNVAFYKGTRDQDQNTYLSRVQPSAGYGLTYSGVAYAVLQNMYIGSNPYLKPWSFLATRIKKQSPNEDQWYSQYAEIAMANDRNICMNPIHIIRECMTNKDWGMGYDISSYDNTNFQECAKTVYEEGIGLSLLWDGEKEIEEFIIMVLQHIDGMMFVDPQTGYFTIKLVRDDYEESGLATINEDSIVEITNLTVPKTGELVSQVTVKYWDFDKRGDSVVTVQDIALVQDQGVPISTTVQYAGCTDSHLANVLATRDLRTLSTPLTGFTLELLRDAGDLLKLGDVIKVNYSRYGISGLVVRIMQIDYGTEVGNTYKVDVVEDIFRVGDTVYATPPDSGWENPVGGAKISSNRFYTTAPYREVYQRYDAANFEVLADETELLLATATKPTRDSVDMAWFNDRGEGGALVDIRSVTFTPHAVLATAVGKLDTEVSYVSESDIAEVEVGEIAYINDEIVRVDAIDSVNKKVTIARGCLDTYPQTHNLNSEIVFFDESGTWDGHEYVAGDVVENKLLTRTISDQLELDEAPADRVNIVERFSKPYPSGNVKLNGEHYPNEFTGDINLTWNGRNKITIADKVFDFTSGDLGIEVGTTNTLTIRNETHSVDVLVVTGIADFNATFTEQQERDLFGQIGFDYTFTLSTERDGQKAFQDWVHRCGRIVTIIIETQPDGVDVVEGGDAVFTVEATGWANLQWYESVDEGVTWGAIVGATDLIYTKHSCQLEDDGKLFRLGLENPNSLLYTSAARLLVG